MKARKNLKRDVKRVSSLRIAKDVFFCNKQQVGKAKKKKSEMKNNCYCT